MSQAQPDRSIEETRPAGEAARRDAPTAADIQRAGEVLRQLRVHMAGNARHATLQLMPAELGRIQVRMALAQGSLTAVVRAESKETLELLERHTPELRASLAANGIASADVQLELGLEGGQEKGAFDRALDQTPAALPRARRPEAAPTDEPRPQPIELNDSDDGVDTYA